MRVVHCHNLAGVPSTLVKFQRLAGVDASIIVRRRHPFGFVEEKIGRFAGLTRMMHADIVHYHWNTWIEKMGRFGFRNPDARFLSVFGRKLVVHHHGDDLRRSLVKIRFEPAYRFVSTPDLLEFAPDAEWLPNPVDTTIFNPARRVVEPETHIIGYYSPPPGSGYVPIEEIEKAAKNLERKGFRIETRPAKGINFIRMPDYFSALTLWVDKLDPECGAYSLMACEAAAMGLPVIASTWKIKHHLSQEVFYEATQDLVGDIRYLIEDDQERRRLGQRGRRYVQEYHEASKVAKRTIEVYRSVSGD